jgi:spermidine dehydrogenase
LIFTKDYTLDNQCPLLTMINFCYKVCSYFLHGANVPITRRDFLNGVAYLGAGIALGLPSKLFATQPPRYYPPVLTGMRGSHPGSFEIAHQLAWNGDKEFGLQQGSSEAYDLIIVGAGISGLSAAWFYQQEYPKARILILDNHDDFGGHAKRNEFTVNDQLLLSYGGTQSIDSPSSFSDVSLNLLQSLGIDLETLKKSYDKSFFQKYNLSLGVFYDKKTFGSSKLLKSGIPTNRSVKTYSKEFIPGLEIAPNFLSTLHLTPLTPKQRAKIKEVFTVSPQAKAYFEGDLGEEKFFTNNYVQFLEDVYSINDPALIALLSMPLVEDAALGGTSVSLPDAVLGNLLGLPPRSFFKKFYDEDEHSSKDEYIYHFPDGNATLARLLVHRLIPSIAPISSASECVTAPFDYHQLDQNDHNVHIRLNALAVSIANKSQKTHVKYVKDDKLYSAHAPHTIMAGWHMMGAHIIQELPKEQKEAMRANIKIPIVYAQVALKQWKAIHKSATGASYCPASFFQYLQLDFPVSIGEYQPKRTPEQPTVITMIHIPSPMLGEGSPAELFKQGRYDLLATTFETFEQHIRDQLQEMYGSFGFDHQHDIAAITINRWSHGFVYDGAEYKGEPAHLQASQRFGNVVIANADAAGSAYTDAAIDMAYKAVQEIL